MRDNAVLPAEQSGFRECHSTTTRFVQFLQHISTGLLQQTASLVICMDSTKAFDQLWHDGLLYKLHRMNCPHELVSSIIQYLKNRKCYIEMNQITSSIFEIEKGVPQGSCLGPILFLLFHCEMAQRIPSATHAHLFADVLALIVNASPWWHRSEFASQMQETGQKALNEVQAYSVEWKQPINFPKTDWQWMHRRVVIPTLSLSIGQHPIKRTAVYKYLGYHVDERLSFSEHCTRMLQKVQKNSSILKYATQSKISSTRARNLISQAFIQHNLQMIYAIWPPLPTSIFDNCLVSFTIGRMRSMTKCDGYQTTRQQNRKHSAPSGDSSIKLKRSHPNSSKVIFSARPCLCICACTSKSKRLSMLYLEKDSASTSMIGWILPWKINDNATWIVYRFCSIKNAEHEMKQQRERDWKLGLPVEFPITTIFDPIKALAHTITDSIIIFVSPLARTSFY